MLVCSCGTCHLSETRAADCYRIHWFFCSDLCVLVLMARVHICSGVTESLFQEVFKVLGGSKPDLIRETVAVTAVYSPGWVGNGHLESFCSRVP